MIIFKKMYWSKWRNANYYKYHFVQKKYSGTILFGAGIAYQFPFPFLWEEFPDYCYSIENFTDKFVNKSTLTLNKYLAKLNSKGLQKKIDYLLIPNIYNSFLNKEIFDEVLNFFSIQKGNIWIMYKK